MFTMQLHCSVLVYLHCWCCGLNTRQPPIAAIIRWPARRSYALETTPSDTVPSKGIASSANRASVAISATHATVSAAFPAIATMHAPFSETYRNRAFEISKLLCSKKKKDYKHDGVPPLKAKYGRKGCAGQTMSQSPYLILDYQAFMI
jgi:hypothetical protein